MPHLPDSLFLIMWQLIRKRLATKKGENVPNNQLQLAQNVIRESPEAGKDWALLKAKLLLRFFWVLLGPPFFY
jgi:hypothetical protein